MSFTDIFSLILHNSALTQWSYFLETQLFGIREMVELLEYRMIGVRVPMFDPLLSSATGTSAITQLSYQVVGLLGF